MRAGRENERGVTLIWVASMMLLLLGAAAFAIDLGWLYLNGSRLQRAADSAAMAGVVNLPTSPAQALTDAQAATARNGFVVPSDATLTPTVLADNRYQVELAAEVDTFFLRALGFTSMDISRQAIAEYIKPVRLGSPNNTFGGPDSNFWAAINGEYTEKEQGDPYATRCLTTPHGNGQKPQCTTFNPEYNGGLGYFYAIEVAAGSTNLNVELYDPVHYVNNAGGKTSNTGDISWRPNWSPRFMATTFRLLRPDNTPYDPSDNQQICQRTWGTSETAAGANQWVGLCSISGAVEAGVYILHIPSPPAEGATKFGIRANTGGGPAPRVYGLFNMSIYVNITGNETTPYLAEIRPEHIGKTFELDIFDLGDNDGNAWFEILDPTGNATNCAWTSDNGLSSGGLGTCRVTISDQRFNNDWIYLRMPLDGYTCDTSNPVGCWWKIRIHNEGQAHDRTTWSARLTGNPIHLIHQG